MEQFRDKLKAIWPDWEIAEKIGEGSFGVVFKAVRHDLAGTTFAAIKAICIPKDKEEIEELKAEGLTLDQSYSYFKQVVKDYTHEIKLMDSVKGYTNIVSIDDYKIVESDDQMLWYIFIRMELLTPLVKKVAVDEITETEIIRAGIDLCTALDVCRKKSIVHRDIKPQNIFINDEGDYKLGDFGVARSLNRAATTLSRKGAPNYMAPELYKNSLREIDINDAAKVDIYSLGLVLYWMGNKSKLPFLSSDKQITTPQDREEAFIRRISGEALPGPTQVSPELQRIILKACAYAPEDRYASAEEMRKDLIRLRDQGRDNIIQAGEHRENSHSFEKEKHEEKKQLKPVRFILPAILVVVIGFGLALFLRSVEPLTNPPIDTTSPQIATETPTIDEDGWSEWSEKRCESDESEVMEEETREVFRWWAAQCTACGRNNPYHGKTEVCHNCGNSLANDQGLWRSVFQYTEETGETEVIDGRDKGRLFGTEPYWLESKKVIQYRYKTETNDPLPTADHFIEEDSDTAIPLLTETPDLTEPAGPQAQGSCGDNAVWSYKNGALMISGTGDVSDFDDSPWTAFSDEISSVIVSEGITSIGNNAFMDHVMLEHVSLPVTLTRIGDFAFCSCTGLRTIEFPESLKSIGHCSFDLCANLTYVSIPANVTEIASTAFSRCDHLEMISVVGNNPVYCSENGILFSKDKTILLRYPEAREGAYTVPSYVTIIGWDSFSYSLNLKEITIHKNVQTIGGYAFEGCDALRTVTFEDGANTSLQVAAIRYCENLADVHIPNGVTYDDADFGSDSIFDGCPNITVHAPFGSPTETYVTNLGIRFEGYDVSGEVKYTSILKAEVPALPTTGPEQSGQGEWPERDLGGIPVIIKPYPNNDKQSRRQAYLGPEKNQYPGAGSYRPAMVNSASALFREGDYVLVDLLYETKERCVYFRTDSLQVVPASLELVTLTGYPAKIKQAAVAMMGPGNNYEALETTIKSQQAVLEPDTEIMVFFEYNGWVFAEFDIDVGKVRAWLAADMVSP